MITQIIISQNERIQGWLCVSQGKNSTSLTQTKLFRFTIKEKPCIRVEVNNESQKFQNEKSSKFKFRNFQRKKFKNLNLS